MLVGLDVGYRAVKAVSGGKKVQFASAVSPYRSYDVGIGSAAEPLALEVPWPIAAGDEAVLYYKRHRRHEDRGWWRTDDYLALVYLAISEMARGSADVHIVTGLPASFFFRDKEHLEKRLSGVHTFRRVGRRSQTVKVQAKVTAQPVGTLLSMGVMPGDRRRIGILDIGGKTTNLLGTSGIRPRDGEIASLDLGGWDVVMAVRDWLIDQGADDPQPYDVERALREGSITFYGERVSVSQARDEAAAVVAEDIVARAHTLWPMQSLDLVVLTGGGALLLGEAIKQRLNHRNIVVADDPVFANALGFYRLARLLRENGW